MDVRHVPHLHGCPGCEREWECQNPSCTDLYTHLCGCDQPVEIKVLQVLDVEKAGHLVDEAAFKAWHGGEKDLADRIRELRHAIIGHVREMAVTRGIRVE